jgi:hypothetical protein
VDNQEFYQLLDRHGISDDIHLFNQKLREWEDYYNYHRPHGALEGQTPFERLIEKTRADVSQGYETLHPVVQHARGDIDAPETAQTHRL